MSTGMSGIIGAAVAERRGGRRNEPISATILSSGEGWRLLDVLCTCGPDDLIRDEQHSHFSLAMVLGGAFGYRGSRGSAELAPGSILLGQPGDQFRCWHETGVGDRCLAVQFDADSFEALTSGLDSDSRYALPLALPVRRATAGLFAFAEIVAERGLRDMDGLDTAVRLADRILGDAGFSAPAKNVPLHDAQRIIELARWIEDDPAAPRDVATLARSVGLSKYHFVRTFRKVVGTPPYAFITRARLRDACKEIVLTGRRIIDIALNAGFSDLSTFNHLIKKQFGVSPRALRSKWQEGETHALLELEAAIRLS